VEITAEGSNYINGSFYAVGSNGVTVRGLTFAGANGAVIKTQVTKRGQDLNPVPDTWIITHLGQDAELQDKSITSLVIDSGGQNYVAGDIATSGGGGGDFSATFTVDDAGAIDHSTIDNHGKNYTSHPDLDLLYQGSSVLQASVPVPV
jgi:hypothetical protein